MQRILNERVDIANKIISGLTEENELRVNHKKRKTKTKKKKRKGKK